MIFQGQGYFFQFPIEVSLGWVKAHIGILGNEAADVCAKRAAEKCRTWRTICMRRGYPGGVSDSGRGRERKAEELGGRKEGEEEAAIGRAMK